MTEFAQEVDAWHDFLALSGTAAVTLLGLLFIAVSLRTDIRTQDASGLQRTATGHSFSNYPAVLLFSLYFLIPNQGRGAFAWEILLTSLVPLVNLCRSYLRLRHSTEMTPAQRLWLFGVPALCFLAGIGVSLAFFLNDETEIGWFVAIVALLFAVPTRSALDLILENRISDG